MPKPKSEAPTDSDYSFGVVFVNELGRTAMLSAQPMTFPVGSILVRERLAKKDDTKPQRLVVMIKRERGFNLKRGDWEYLVVDGALTKIRERHKSGACANCHAQQKDRDFVFPLATTK